MMQRLIALLLTYCQQGTGGTGEWALRRTWTNNLHTCKKRLSTTQTGCTEALQLTSCQEGSGRVVLI